MVMQYRNRLYDSYRSGLGLSACAVNMVSTRHIVRRLRKDLPADRSAAIIDLGCGSGELLGHLREMGYRGAIGVDTSKQQIAVARSRGVTQVEHADGLGFLRSAVDESVEMVITWDVIEHLTKDETIELAERIQRVLRPGGRWVIHVPNAESPFFGRIRYGDWTHEQAFTRSSLDQLLCAVGFQQVRYEEDGPVVHGFMSGVRRVLWTCFRTLLRLYLAAETGDVGRQLILSQNLMAVATKPRASAD